jgi:chemotaxis protein CheZ
VGKDPVTGNARFSGGVCGRSTELSVSDTSEIIQAQAFQDLVGQVINKLMVMVQKMEDSLVHLLVDDESGPGACWPVPP